MRAVLASAPQVKARRRCRARPRRGRESRLAG